MTRPARHPVRLGIALASVALVAAAVTMTVGERLTAVSAAPVAADAAPAPQPSGAVAFVERVVRLVVDDDYRRAWRTLHPAHQRVAPLREYVTCEERSPIPGRLSSITVLDVRSEQLRVAGPRTVTSTAVRMRLTIRDLATGQRTAVTSTFHAVPLDGRWRWVMPQQRFALYRANACATPAAPGRAY